MSLEPLAAPRFVRRTSLGANEYRKNFRQLDREVIDAVTSREADRVTPLMGKIYLRLSNAPDKYWEREGVLRFEADPGEEKPVNAWAQLCEVAGVASATAAKALRWMHEQGVIGYFAGKNGAGIRIFLNRASSSIGVRRGQAGEKILAFPRASSGKPRASAGEAAFSDSYAGLEVLETDKNSRAPKNGADSPPVGKTASRQNHEAAVPSSHEPQCVMPPNPATPPGPSLAVPVEEIVRRLRSELEPALREAARQAATREHERTREWLENRGLPKAARVAQHETYNVLRKYGLIDGAGRAAGSTSEVGRGGCTPPESRPLSGAEADELAQACVAMLEAQGRPVERTLSEMSIEGGGFLLPADAARVRERAVDLLGSGGIVQGR
jgi:hypothetical protein